MTGSLRTDWQDGDQVHGSDIDAQDVQINADTAAIDTIAKLVVIGDNCWGISPAGNATSTVGTSRLVYTIGQDATGISVRYNHFSTNSVTVDDTDPSGPISFRASLEVVSSTELDATLDPGTTVGTIIPFKFDGRTTVTLDPGGDIEARVLGISLKKGDRVAVRTFLVSGTAIAPRQSYGTDGGFTPTSDLTVPGSAAISASAGVYYGPAALLGYADVSPKSVGVTGDSVPFGGGDIGGQYSVPTIQPSNYAIRALSGEAGMINFGVSGEVSEFIVSASGFRRLDHLKYCTSAIIEDGINDIVTGVTAAEVEASNLELATHYRRFGIGKVFVQTLIPRTTSTDYWATTTHQTVTPSSATEAQRVAYNNWVRAGCPIDPTTLAPLAVGATGALLAGNFGHPFTDIFDTCSAVETETNSGLWIPATKVVTDASLTSGSNLISSATAAFNSATVENGGDIGAVGYLYGAGPSGGVLGPFNFAGDLSSTQIYISTLASTTVSGAKLVINTMTWDGAHPSSLGHDEMSQKIDVSKL